MTIILCWLGLHRRPESISSGLYCCARRGCGLICGVPLPLKSNTNREKQNG